ncbi:MAG: polyprenyl synthetase family protein [Desulfobacterales bacterium]
MIQHQFVFNLNSYLESKINYINNELEKIIDLKSSNLITRAVVYSLMSGGKRLRPVLCIAAAEAVGSEEKYVIPAACALEIIHTYSLIHDDLPPMDNDSLRRGKQTCHIAFDEATAILAGDALLTLSFQVLSNIDANSCNADKWLKVIHLISVAAGYKGMIEGQMRDISYENRDISIEELETMHSLKTGALIEASVKSGAILGNGNPKQIEQLETYAKNIGLAFQITDDLLNVTGDSSVTGKEIGTDKARNKCTYPALLGISESETYAKKLVNNALNAIELFDNRSDPLRAIAMYIIERKR